MSEFAENYFVEKNLLPPPINILCFGSIDDSLKTILLERGYSITSVDMRKDDSCLHYRDYRFIHKNIFDTVFEECFDAAYAISTIEHCGLDVYGTTTHNENGDAIALQKLYDSVKPGGMVLATVPFGTFPLSKEWRVYDKQTLQTLTSPFKAELIFYEAVGEKMLNMITENTYNFDIERFYSDFKITKEKLPPKYFLGCLYDGVSNGFRNIGAMYLMNQLDQLTAERTQSVACIKIKK